MNRAHNEIISEMREILTAKLGESVNEYFFPPPIFKNMQGEFRLFDAAEGIMMVRFPIREHYRNPYGAMQGGMIAAAVDNTIGPLSVLVAPLNVTRKLEMTYSKPVMPEMKFIDVSAKYTGREERRLYFTASVYGPDETRLARCKTTNWIIVEEQI